MRCPFLCEMEVRFCEAAPFRKMLRATAQGGESGSCAQPGWTRCPWASARGEAALSSMCPSLRTSSVLYCSVAPQTCLVPYSESLTSACQGEGHEYCDLYLAMAKPRRHHTPPDEPGGDENPEEPAPSVEGLEVPTHLALAPNHLWIDERSDDSCHIGIDAFAARVLGKVDAVEFTQTRGVCRPAAVLTVGDTDLTFVFPHPVHVVRANLSLRLDPTRLTEDPLGRGWLFAAREPWVAGSVPQGRRASDGLRKGQAAVDWTRDEIARLNDTVHNVLAAASCGPAATLHDGGGFVPGLARSVDRTSLLRLHQDFFSLEGGRDS